MGYANVEEVFDRCNNFYATQSVSTLTVFYSLQKVLKASKHLNLFVK